MGEVYARNVYDLRFGMGKTSGLHIGVGMLRSQRVLLTASPSRNTCGDDDAGSALSKWIRCSFCIILETHGHLGRASLLMWPVSITVLRRGLLFSAKCRCFSATNISRQCLHQIL